MITITHPKIQQTKINYAGIEKVAKYGFELAWKVVQSDAAPRFNYGSFKEMEYKHDHGHGVEFPHGHSHEH